MPSHAIIIPLYSCHVCQSFFKPSVSLCSTEQTAFHHRERETTESCGLSALGALFWTASKDAPLWRCCDDSATFGPDPIFLSVMMCRSFPRNAGTTELQRAAEKNQVEIRAGTEVRSAPVLLLNRLLSVCMVAVTLIVICASLYLSVFLKPNNHINMRNQTHGCDLSSV